MASVYDNQPGPVSDQDLVRQALGARPPVEQMVVPGGPQNAASGYLDALSNYERMVNEALRYLNQPIGQSTPPSGINPSAGVPTPQEFMRQPATSVPPSTSVPSVLPSPSMIAQKIAMSPPISSPVNPLIQMQDGIVNTQTGRAVPMPQPKPNEPPPEVSRAHAKLKKSEGKRSNRFDRGKYIPPEDQPYKQGGDVSQAKALRQRMSIEGMFR